MSDIKNVWFWFSKSIYFFNGKKTWHSIDTCQLQLQIMNAT
uniref:Uncharacterized protein n=1 Tax=Anguilla anguilla TaxID=7936 RepID=A0A0E9PSR3_ANGAN